MKFFSSILALAAAIPFASAYRKGFNMGANRPDGACKDTADWSLDFSAMKKIPGGFRSVRLYASSDCGTLAYAVPAAKSHGISVLVGVWTEDEAHYEREKAALERAIKDHGLSWITAVSVGSEDLYRGDTSASVLAQKVNDIRALIRSHGGKNIPVGHVDTWTAWVNDANAAVIKACEFIGMDGYPYFQGTAIKNAGPVFQQSIDATKAAIARYHPGTPMWITETGWPLIGDQIGEAKASQPNAKTYWHKVMCPRFDHFNFYVYTLRDVGTKPSFGVLSGRFKPLYTLAC